MMSGRGSILDSILGSGRGSKRPSKRPILPRAGGGGGGGGSGKIPLFPTSKGGPRPSDTCLLSAINPRLRSPLGGLLPLGERRRIGGDLLFSLGGERLRALLLLVGKSHRVTTRLLDT